MAVQLTINSDANIQGIEKAQRALEQLGMSGKSANQVFKNSGDLEAYKAALQRSYNSAALFNGQLKASQQAITMANTAFKQAQQYLGADPSRTFRFIDEQGIEQQTRDLGIIQKQIFSFLKDVEADTDTFRKAATKNLRSTFSMEGVEKGAEAVRMFGTELEAVEFKMSKIKEQGLHLSSIHGDPKEIQKLSEAYQKLTIEHDKLSKAANGTGERIKNLIKNFVSAQLIVWAIRKGFQLLTQGLKEASTAAAEAEQVYQKFLTVFNNMQIATDSVSKLVNEFGLANSSARDIMSTIGDMATGLGATDAEAAAFAGTTAEFIQDLIAFKDVGGDVIEITKAFMSGAAGNTRNFRQWGSIVKEANVQARLHEKGLDRLTGSELEWAKAQERVAIVMEQQKNAMGATEREWDMFLSVQRRYTEQTKQLKENIGRTINEAWLPLKRVLLDVVEGWNKAYEAEENYLNKTDAPTPLFNLKTEDGRKAAKQSLQQFFSKREGNPTVFGVTYGIDAEDIEAAARAYGITAKEVAELAINNFENNSALAKQVSLIDQKIAKEKKDKKALEDEKLALKAYSEQVSSVVDQISSITGVSSLLSSSIGPKYNKTSNMIMGSSAISDMINQFSNRKPSEFVDALDAALGIGDEEGLKAKQQKVREAYEVINNALIKAVAGGDEKGVEKYTGILSSLVKIHSEITAGITDASYDKQIADLEKSNELLKGNLLLEKQFGDEGSEWLALENARLEAIRKANDEYAERAKNPEDEASALADQERMIELINEQYGINLELLGLKLSREEEITAEKEKQALIDQRASAIDQGNQTLSDIRRSNAMFGMSDSERAKAEITNAVEDFAAMLIRNGVEFDDVLSMSAQYRMEKEIEAENEYQKALNEARQAVIDSIISAWEGTGDVGMIKGWVEAFASGGPIAGIAQVSTDLLTSFESVNELLSIVTKFIEYVAPAVDQFLAPLMPVLEMLVSIVADLFLPVLQILFPIIQQLSVALIFVTAVVKTVTNALSWLVDSIATAVYNIIHPFRQRAFRDLGDETVAIWSEANEQVAEIMNMELDTRMEFVDKLTEAQQGQLDAYNEMFKSGMLTLTQYNALVGKNVYGKNFDNVDIASFASGGDFVTNGERIIRVGEAGPERVTITPLNSTKYANRGNTAISNASYSVVVNGANADPEEIAMSVRREFKRMERRGVKYA